MNQKYAKKNGSGRNAALSESERRDLITRYAYLVTYIAGRVSVRLPSRVMFDELISAGSMGLIDAVDKYQPEREVSFKTYAQYRIRGAILDELRNMDWYSRSMRKKIQEVEQAVQKIEARVGRPAMDEEVAGELGIPLEKYFKMLSDIHGAAILSLDSYIKNDGNDSSSKTTFRDGMRSSDNPVESVMKKEMQDVLTGAIKRLSEKEQVVISLYYYDELTLKEIGTVMGLTESRICQIHTMALIKLKNRVKEYRR